LREECRQRVFENRVLRRIFGPKGDEVMGSWINLQSGKLNDMYSSPNIIQVIKSRKMRWPRHVVHMGEMRGVYSVLVGCEGKRQLGKPRCRWEDDINPLPVLFKSLLHGQKDRVFSAGI
jgi:hypothetical protein